MTANFPRFLGVLVALPLIFVALPAGLADDKTSSLLDSRSRARLREKAKQLGKNPAAQSLAKQLEGTADMYQQRIEKMTQRLDEIERKAKSPPVPAEPPGPQVDLPLGDDPLAPGDD